MKKMEVRVLWSTICLMLFLFVACGRDGAYRKLHIAEDIIESSPDSALSIIGKLRYDKLNDESQALYGLLYTAGRYKCELPVANDTLINRSIRYYHSIDDTRHLANAYYYKGAVNYSRKNYSESISHLKRAEALSENFDDELLKNKIYELLAYINNATDCKTLSLFYSKKFMESSIKMGDAELISRGFACVASSYYSLGHADSAVIYMNKCMPQISRFNFTLQADILANVGALACQNNDTLQAELLLRKSLKIKENPYAYYVLGKIEYSKGHKKNVEQYWHKALKTDDEKLKVVILKHLSEYYYRENIPNKAYEYSSKESSQFKKNYETSNEILQYQMKFDAEQAEQSLHNYIKVLLPILLFAIVMLLAYVAYHKYKVTNYKRKIKAGNDIAANYKAEADEQRERIALYENDKAIYESRLKSYMMELDASKTKIADLQSRDRSLQKKIEILMDEIKQLPQSVTDALRKGAAIYEAIRQKKAVTCYSDDDISKLIDFYSIVEEKTFAGWTEKYRPLTVRQYLFLIVDTMKYPDYDIADILGVSESAVRVTRSRIRKKKR